MKWKNLKNNKCPKCFGDLWKNEIEGIYECPECNEFIIGIIRFDEIVGSQIEDGDSKEGDENESFAD